MDLPFDGAISAFFKDEAPAEIRNAIKRAEKGEILNPNYPHSERLARKVYEKDLHNLQIELAKLQAAMQESGERIVIVFEGRDAAGKAARSNGFART